ncbi:MAG: FG-GAP-like repeat-containing protein [Bacteroidia bacterium]|nr:FG-GAP-like repeat-containing protein [Bacteroidia bacterium]
MLTNLYHYEMKSHFTFICLCLLSFAAQGQDFLRVEQEAGLGHVTRNNGVSVADYDADGDLDLFFVGYRSFVEFDSTTWNRLMRNNGDGTFTDVTIEAGLTNQFANTDIQASIGEKMGASWGDYDNDGFPDLFLANSRADQLYHNDGDGTFTEVTEASGIVSCHTCYSSAGLWVDYDRDRDLDLYIPVLNGDNILYQNKGDGTFEDVTLRMGINGVGVTWTAVAFDINGDGFQDILDVNDTQINNLWENKSGQGFADVSLPYRMNDTGAGMGVTIGDYNNDGLFDVYITQIYNYLPNPLFKNTGQRRFENVAAAMGVENTGWGWGTHFLDYDHDGDEDLFAVNGVVSKQYIGGQEQLDEPNYFYRNTLIEGTEGFVDWTTETSTGEMARARGLEVFDYDSDGDLDMVVANVETTPFLYQNQTVSESQSSHTNWLQIDLEGTQSNRNAFGAQVTVTTAEGKYHRLHHGACFYGQSIKPVHVGLGAAELVERIIVLWPSGNRDTLLQVAINQKISIKETPREKSLNAPVISGASASSTFPNPFDKTTTMRFDLPRGGSLSLKVFDSMGKLVYTTEVQVDQAQRIELPWGGNTTEGVGVSSGIYLYEAVFTTLSEDIWFRGKMMKSGT